jgi:transcriptional regulator with XRE-family HTH domain
MRSRFPSATLASGLLRDARQRAGLTQEEVATKAGVARPLISQYETGRKDPSLTTLARLIEACGMELRVRADMLSLADLAQYAQDARVGSEEALRNAERARRQILGVRRPSAGELARLRGVGRA